MNSKDGERFFEGGFDKIGFVVFVKLLVIKKSENIFVGDFKNGKKRTCSKDRSLRRGRRDREGDVEKRVYKIRRSC